MQQKYADLFVKNARNKEEKCKWIVFLGRYAIIKM